MRSYASTTKGSPRFYPEVKVGDQVKSLTGVLDFRLGQYCIQLLSPPEVLEARPSRQFLNNALLIPAISAATFNLDELFNTEDDPLTEDQALSITEYQRRLQKRALAIQNDLKNPAILAFQEAETFQVLEDMLSRPEIGESYQILHVDGPDQRGLDLALAFRADLVNLITYEIHQGCTGLIDGLEPDGNGDPANPQNALTCDRNNDGVLDGNRLFSRPPLIAHLWVRSAINYSASQQFFDFWVIACHFKSKVDNSSTTAYTLPRRLEQARFVAALVNEINQAKPSSLILVLGDLNDHPDSEPLQTLASSGLVISSFSVNHPIRYTYIYQGISQTLDYALFTLQPSLQFLEAHAVHINSDYPEYWMSVSDTSQRSSDHDPFLIQFAPTKSMSFIPVILR